MSESRQNLAVNPILHRRVKVRSLHEGKTLQEMTESMVAFALAHMGKDGKPKEPKK